MKEPGPGILIGGPNLGPGRTGPVLLLSLRQCIGGIVSCALTCLVVWVALGPCNWSYALFFLFSLGVLVVCLPLPYRVPSWLPGRRQVNMVGGNW